MRHTNHLDLIYPWNHYNYEGNNTDRLLNRHLQNIELDDETLRDGLQSPSVRVPDIEEKLKILHYQNDLGIHIANVGIPAAGESVKNDVLRLAQEIASEKMNLRISCGARTVISDIEPIVEISQKTGVPIEAHVFIGSSMIRRYAEDWDLNQMLKNTEKSVEFCVNNGLEVMFVTEDTTRAEPRLIEQLYKTAIQCGAKRICLCDTVGYATPDGVRNLVAFAKKIIWDTGEDIKIDWHGHNDRGFALSNALVAAIDSRVDRVQGTCLGIGERAGNTSIDQLMVNLFLKKMNQSNLNLLGEYCQYVSRVCDVPIQHNYPIMGKDAFRTATGVHAAAIIKAQKKEESQWLADYVYSAVPAQELGMEQIIEIGPVSGKSNVIYWLEKRNLEATPELVDKIFARAKLANHVLRDDEIHKILKKETQKTPCKKETCKCQKP